MLHASAETWQAMCFFQQSNVTMSQYELFVTRPSPITISIQNVHSRLLACFVSFAPICTYITCHHHLSYLSDYHFRVVKRRIASLLELSYLFLLTLTKQMTRQLSHLNDLKTRHLIRSRRRPFRLLSLVGMERIANGM